MSKNSKISKQSEGGNTNHRRHLLKAVAAGGSALSLSAVPGKWSKPVVASVMLPAHGQGSGCLGSVNNCPDNEFQSISFECGNTENPKYFYLPDVAATVDGISIVGNTLDGSGTFRTMFPLDFTDCGECAEGNAFKYKYASFLFGSRNVNATAEGSVMCGGNTIEYITGTFVGSYYSTRDNTNEVYYTGSCIQEGAICEYLGLF